MEVLRALTQAEDCGCCGKHDERKGEFGVWCDVDFVADGSDEDSDDAGTQRRGKHARSEECGRKHAGCPEHRRQPWEKSRQPGQHFLLAL